MKPGEVFTVICFSTFFQFSVELEFLKILSWWLNKKKFLFLTFVIYSPLSTGTPNLWLNSQVTTAIPSPLCPQTDWVLHIVLDFKQPRFLLFLLLYTLSLKGRIPVKQCPKFILIYQICNTWFQVKVISLLLLLLYLPIHVIIFPQNKGTIWNWDLHFFFFSSGTQELYETGIYTFYL